ncbi:hypothetical protein C4588_06260 [Candidatus Parcubacteria bacterium]|nr:MAG: hypothetical protein C4588_06260 [Candidatus Parcubacteria bacterium]
MFELSYNQAATIQRAQMVYYRNLIGRKGVKAIKAKTGYPDFDPDKQVNAGIINELVPRGGDFEQLINYRGQKSCPDAGSWHDAIRKGFF